MEFLEVFPGLVGGHCIGVDPYYLTHKAARIGYHAQIINSGRFVNDSMGGYIAKQAIKKLISADKEIKKSKALIMGFTFKENVSDIRNTKVADIYKELKSYGLMDIEVFDPVANDAEVFREYQLHLTNQMSGNYDLIIAAVAHKQFLNYSLTDFKKLSNQSSVFIDVKGIFKQFKNEFIYWSL